MSSSIEHWHHDHSNGLEPILKGGELIRIQQAIDIIEDFPHGDVWNVESMEEMIDRIKQLPSAESESFEWCTNCKEYDQEAHCCHRWSKMIRKTIEEMKVVRCKDCIYADYMDDIKALWCSEGGRGRTVAPYDFCSYAERREDG